METNKKGVSLIVLIITIIVVLILVAVVALNLKGSNTISDAYESKFKSDITTFRDELTMWLSNEYGIEKQKINLSTINATKDTSTYKNILMQEMIKSMDDNYADKLIVEEAELKFIGSDHEEIEWFNEIMNSSGLKDLKGIKQISSAGTVSLALMNDGTVKSWGGPPPVLGVGYVNYHQPWPQTVIEGEPKLEEIAYMDNIPGMWTQPIQSDRIIIEFESDSSYNDAGFIIAKIRYTLNSELIEEKLETPIIHINYGSYEYEKYEIYKPGATNISVNFSLLSLEEGYDSVYISDYNRTVTNEYTGNTYLDSMDMLKPAPLSGVRQISAGIMSNFALMENGTVKTWGVNPQVDDEDYSGMPISPFPTTVSGLTNVKKVVSNAGMCLALMNDGSVKYWGISLFDKSIIPSPRTIFGLKGVKDISAGIFDFVFLMEDGTVRENGLSFAQMLMSMGGGEAPEITPFSTTVAVNGLTNVKKISAGAMGNVALMEDGTLKTWGYDIDFILKAKHIMKDIFDLMYESEMNDYVPTQAELDAIIADLANLGVEVDPATDIEGLSMTMSMQFADTPKVIENIDNVKDIAMGTFHLVTTYNDDTAQVHGLTTRSDFLDIIPFMFGGGPAVKFNLEENDFLTFAHNFTNGNIDMFNRKVNSSDIIFEKVADYDDEFPRINVFTDDVILENVKDIEVGLDTALILLNDGTLWSLGENYYGQIGDGSFSQSSYPIQIDPTIFHELYMQNNIPV